MIHRRSQNILMIMDACVLIDFIKADPVVLQLIVKHVGLLHVIGPVIDEVDEIEDENDLIELGLIVVEPEIEDAFTAGSLSGPLSFQDWLCMLTAKRHHFSCVTNDKNLRKQCKNNGISAVWGLEILAALHKSGGLSGADVLAIAKQIRTANPTHITEKIISNFEEIIKGQETE